MPMTGKLLAKKEVRGGTKSNEVHSTVAHLLGGFHNPVFIIFVFDAPLSMSRNVMLSVILLTVFCEKYEIILVRHCLLPGSLITNAFVSHAQADPLLSLLGTRLGHLGLLNAS